MPGGIGEIFGLPAYIFIFLDKLPGVDFAYNYKNSCMTIKIVI